MSEARRPCAPCLDCQQILFTQTSSGSSSAPTRAACTGVARTAWPQSASANWMRRAWKSLNATDARTKKSPRPSPGRNSCRQMRTFLRRCLKCLQVQRAGMQCCLPMLPHQGSDRFDATNGHHACQWNCALTMSRRGTKRRTRVFFSCRACQKVYAIAVAVGKDRAIRRRGHRPAAVKTANENGQNHRLLAPNASATAPLSESADHFIWAKAR